MPRSDHPIPLKEVAFELDITIKTLRRWIARGEVRVVQPVPRSRVRVPADEVARLRRTRRITDGV